MLWPTRRCVRRGSPLAAATGDGRYRASFESVAEDAKLPEDVRVAAVEALGSIKVTPNRVLDQLIASVRGQPSSNALAEAAVRAAAKLYDSRDQLVELLTTRAYPLGVRREALRAPGTVLRRRCRACSTWPARASCPRT